jgi:WD40 repeat protein
MEGGMSEIKRNKLFKIKRTQMNTNRNCWRKFMLYFLTVLILSIPIATKAVAGNWNILEKGWHKMTANHKERQIISWSDEKSDANITAVAWSPDGKSIATAGEKLQVTIWDAASLSIRHQLEQGDRGCGQDNITFSPDSRYLASGLSIINLWNVADGTLQSSLIAPHITGKPHDVEIVALRFSPDGRMLVVVYGGEKRIIIAYRVADGKIIWTYEPEPEVEQLHKVLPRPTTPVVFTPDGKQVIMGTIEFGGSIVSMKKLTRALFLNAQTGKFLRSIDNIHMGLATALAISPDGKLMATGTETGVIDKTTNTDPVRIWNTSTGKMVKELPVHSRVRSLAFSRDGKYLFGAKSNIDTHLTLAVWDVASGKMVQEVKQNPGPMSLAVSPDGKRLAAACQHKLAIYDITTGN